MSKKEKEVSEEKKKVKKQNKLVKFIKGIKTTTKIIFVLLTIIVLMVGGWIIANTGEEGKTTTISESSLQKIIEINEFAAIEYNYNAVVTKTKPDSTNPMYYVAYEGIVTMGIDFQAIKPELDKKNKIITITIPEIEILDTKVDVGTMDYIFINKKYDTETVSQEAYKLCEEDLEKSVKDEEMLKESARKNVISTVEALFKPFIEAADEGYQLVIQ